MMNGHDTVDDNLSTGKSERRQMTGKPPAKNSIRKPLKKFRASKFHEKATVGELNALVQVEKQSKLNLFDLQAEDVLFRRGLVKPAVHQKIEAYISRLMQIMQSHMVVASDIDVRDAEHVAAMLGNLQVPGFFAPGDNAAKMIISKFTRWFSVGSFSHGCVHWQPVNNHADNASSQTPDMLSMDVDVAIEMPGGISHEKDYLNGRYFYKRACYLTLLAKHFASSIFSTYIDSVRYRFVQGERLRPCLVITPAKDHAMVDKDSTFRIILHLVPPPGVFQPKRFTREQSNLRRKILSAAASTQQQKPKKAKQTPNDVIEVTGRNTPTPNYNRSVLCDLLMEQMARFIKEAIDGGSAGLGSGVVNGILLAKAWLHARQMYNQILSGFQLTMLMLFLLQVDKSINGLMSASHCFRVLLNFMVQWSPKKQKLAFIVHFGEAFADAKGDCHQGNYAVLTDPIVGFLNIFQLLTESDVLFLKAEAALMLSHLDGADSADLGVFQRLFADPVPRVAMFDQKLEICATIHVKHRVQAYVESKADFEQDVLDTLGDYEHVGRQAIWNVLNRALSGSSPAEINNSRCKVLWVEPSEVVEVDVKNADLIKRHCVPPYGATPFHVWFRFDDSAQFMNGVIRGPDMQSPDAKSFRQFWGPQCKLIRFSDTSIAETVVFGQDNTGTVDSDKKTHTPSNSAKRLITSRICQYILRFHFDFNEDDLRYRGGEWDTVLRPVRVRLPSSANGWPALDSNGEEHYDRLLIVFNKLVSVLKNISHEKQQQLPLQVATVIPISAALQKLEVIAPLPVYFACSQRHGKSREALFERARHIKVPPFVPCLLAHVVLEGSGKWPDDNIDAVQRLKAAFHLQLARALRSALTSPVDERVSVLLPDAQQIIVDMHRTEGYIFQLRIVYPREAMLARMQFLPNGMVRMVRTEHSDLLESELHHKPKLISALNGVAANHSLCFPTTVRLAKRWMASQLLLGASHYAVSDEAVELLVASVFVAPAPFDVPRTPGVGFLRFLRLLCTHAWQAMPLMVNFGDKLQRDDVEQIMSRFTAKRSTLPLVFIATPFDRFASIWTAGMRGNISNAAGSSSVSGLIWYRAIQMAAQCLRVVEQRSNMRDADIKLLFRPPLETFDVTIHLHAQHISRRHEAVDVLTYTTTGSAAAHGGGSRKFAGLKRPIPMLKYESSPPVVVDASADKELKPLYDFDTVAYYVAELRSAYDHLALFFYDRYGGDKVFVLWKVQAFAARPFKPSTANGRMLTYTNLPAVNMPGKDDAIQTKPVAPAKVKAVEAKREACIIPNVAAIMENFRTLGGELVGSVEGHYERWKI